MLNNIALKRITPAEESLLISKIQAGKESSDLLINQNITLDRYNEIQKESSIARDALICANIPYLMKCIRKYRRRSQYEDLFSAGCIGLMHSIDTFDPNKSKFITFASHYIKIMISIYLGEDNLIRIPSSVRKDINLVKRQSEIFISTNKENLTIDKLLEITNITKSRFSDIKCYLDPLQSNNVELIESKPNNVDFLENDLIEKCISNLKDREQKIIRMTYGFHPYCREHEISEISQNIGLGRTLISEIKEHALMKIGDTYWSSISRSHKG